MGVVDRSSRESSSGRGHTDLPIGTAPILLSVLRTLHHAPLIARPYIL